MLIEFSANSTRCCVNLSISGYLISMSETISLYLETDARETLSKILPPHLEHLLESGGRLYFVLHLLQRTFCLEKERRLPTRSLSKCFLTV